MKRGGMMEGSKLKGTEVTVPHLAETLVSATVGKWLVKPGDLFFACLGTHQDGRFILRIASVAFRQRNARRYRLGRENEKQQAQNAVAEGELCRIRKRLGSNNRSSPSN